MHDWGGLGTSTAMLGDAAHEQPLGRLGVGSVRSGEGQQRDSHGQGEATGSSDRYRLGRTLFVVFGSLPKRGRIWRKRKKRRREEG